MPTMTPLERINSMKMPFAELKGVAFTEAGKDRVVARMETTFFSRDAEYTGPDR